MAVPQAAHVLYCVEIDSATQTCVQEAWLPAPQLLPPLEASAVGILLGATAAFFAMCWGGKHLGRTTRD